MSLIWSPAQLRGLLLPTLGLVIRNQRLLAWVKLSKDPQTSTTSQYLKKTSVIDRFLLRIQVQETTQINVQRNRRNLSILRTLTLNKFSGCCAMNEKHRLTDEIYIPMRIENNNIVYAQAKREQNKLWWMSALNTNGKVVGSFYCFNLYGFSLLFVDSFCSSVCFVTANKLSYRRLKWVSFRKFRNFD